jgi:alkylation response protein AidB-like acyl-CoA dehydrogenase
MTQDASERQSILDTVGRVAADRIAPLVAHPSDPPSADDIESVLTDLTGQGVLTGADEPGLGIWDDPQDPGLTKLSVRMLAAIAEVSPGIALQVHLRGLAGWLERLAWLLPVRPLVALEPWSSIAGPALSRSLITGRRDPGDPGELAEVWGTPTGPRARLLFGEATWTHLWWPRWTTERGWTLHRSTVEDVSFTPLDHAHGPDEVSWGRWALSALPQESDPTLDGNDGSVLVETFAAHGLGLLAIMRAAAARSTARSREQARIRRRGGRILAEHDAVRALLAEADHAIWSADAALDRLCALPAGPDRLHQIWRARSLLSPQLTDAGSKALQVLGGDGYLQDTGAEKDQRALNALRRLGGSPTDLTARCAAADAPSDTGDGDGPNGMARGSVPETNRPGAADAVAAATDGVIDRSNPLSSEAVPDRFPLLTRLGLRGRERTLWEIESARLPWTLRRIRRRAHRFAHRELSGLALEIDLLPPWPVEEHPRELDRLLESAARARWLSDLLPRPLGGGPLMAARHPLPWAIAVKVEEFARVDGGLMLLLSSTMLGQVPLLLAGNPRSIWRNVVPGVRQNRRGDPYLFALAAAEPGLGSDVEDGFGAATGSPELVARRAEGGWTLNGRKIFVSGGDLAQGFAVFAALADEGYESWTCFFVERQAHGLTCVREGGQMGMRASTSTEMRFDDVFVPESAVVGGLRRGWALNRKTRDLSRIPVAAMGVGFAQAACDIAIDYARRTRVAGRPLLHYQRVQLTIAQMLAETSGIRGQLWSSARLWRSRRGVSAMNKFHATDVAMGVIERAMDLLGPDALLHANRLEKVWRDCRLTQIIEGTNEINRLVLVEDRRHELLEGDGASRGFS